MGSLSYNLGRNSNQDRVPARTPGLHGSNDAGDPDVESELGPNPGPHGYQDQGSPNATSGTNSDNYTEHERRIRNVESIVRTLIAGGKVHGAGKLPPLVLARMHANQRKGGPSYEVAARHIEYWFTGGMRRQGSQRTNFFISPSIAFWPSYSEFILDLIATKHREMLIKGIRSRIQNQTVGPPKWEYDGINNGDLHYDGAAFFTNKDGDGGMYYAYGACNLIVRASFKVAKVVRFGQEYSGDSLANISHPLMLKNDSFTIEFTSALIQFYDTYDWNKGSIFSLLGVAGKDDTFANVEPEVGRGFTIQSEEVLLFGAADAQSTVSNIKNSKAFEPFVLDF